MATKKYSATIGAKVKRAESLIKECQAALLFRDNLGLMTIRDVPELTESTVSNVIKYCEYFIANKTFNGWMPPSGDLARVLKSVELI
jgi:hypothetical protein